MTDRLAGVADSLVGGATGGTAAAALATFAHGGHQVRRHLVLGVARAEQRVAGQAAGQRLLVLAEPTRLVVQRLQTTRPQVVVPSPATLTAPGREDHLHGPRTVGGAAGGLPGHSGRVDVPALQPLLDAIAQRVRAVRPSLGPHRCALGQPDDVLPLGEHRALVAADPVGVPPRHGRDLLGALPGPDHRLHRAQAHPRGLAVGRGLRARPQGRAQTVVDGYGIPGAVVGGDHQPATFVELDELELLHGRPLCHPALGGTRRARRAG
nr:hypothetical protein [Ornithinimicrobium pratense]